MHEDRPHTTDTLAVMIVGLCIGMTAYGVYAAIVLAGVFGWL